MRLSWTCLSVVRWNGKTGFERDPSYPECRAVGFVAPSECLYRLTIFFGFRVLYFLAQRMPFEKILQLKHPDQDDYPEYEDGPQWTADELLSTYALNQGLLFQFLRIRSMS